MNIGTLNTIAGWLDCSRNRRLCRFMF